MKRKQSKGVLIFNVVNYSFLIFLTVICVYPFWHVLMASFSSGNSLIKHTGLMLHITEPTIEAYERVFRNPNIPRGFFNTLVILIVGGLYQMIMTILGAYFLSRRDVLLRRPIMLMILFTMFFQGGMIPFYLNLQDFGLLGGYAGIIVPFAIGTYNLIVLRTAFESIPVSLEDAAKIDGAGHITIICKVILPLSKATLSVLVLYYGVSTWNSWFWASLVISKRAKMPLAVFLRDILISGQMQAMDSGMPTAENIKYALIVVSTVPILCIYPFIQKHFTKGVMIGAVKE